jgi:hypothetical protein
MINLCLLEQKVKIERDNKRKIPNKVKFVRFYLNVLEQFI